jgi:hypothetical protein
MSIEIIGKKRLNWTILQDHGMARHTYKAMVSRFDSTCSVCQGKIETGTPIWFHLQDRTAMHEDCRPRQGV